MSAPTGSDLADYLAALKEGHTDPTGGLPDPVFQFALDIVPMINVDLLIRDDVGRILVAWRADAFGTGWHIPGGIIRRRERFADRIAAVARHELGTMVSADADPCRVTQLPDSGRGHFVSLLFRCSLRGPIATDAAAASPPRPGRLQWAARVPEPLYPAHACYRDLFPE